MAGPPPRPRHAPDVHLTAARHTPPVPGDVAAAGEDQVAPGWFARSQEPPRMPRGATFADAAVHTPPRGVPRITPPHGAPQPAWTPIPPAPAPPGPPSGPPEDGSSRSMRTMAAITAAVVLLAGAATVVVLAPWKSDGDHAKVADASSESPAPGPAADRATQPGRAPGSLTPTAPSPSASPSASASPTAGPAAQATAVSGLLDRSGSSRQSVVDAVRNADSCTSLASAVTALSQAADARNTLLRELDALRTDALPDAADAIAQLRTAWQESATADAQYASWAQAQSDNGCGSGQTQKTAADAASARATTAKQAFVQAWNPIAARYGLPTRTDLAI